jgi:hypothetical protein
MASNNLFLDLLYETNLVSKSDKDYIILKIYNNASDSNEIINLLNKSKFQSELSDINKKQNIKLYNTFVEEFKKLKKIMIDLDNECGDYETGDIDRVIANIIKLCKESYVNYTNDRNESILFYLVRQYYENKVYKKVDLNGCRYSLMHIFDALILNKNFDIDIKNIEGIDAYNLCKKLGYYTDEDQDENENSDDDEYDPDIIFYKISYRRKLNKKK